LSFEDWCILFEGVTTLVIVQAALPLVNFPRLLSWATVVHAADWVAASPASIERTVWLVGLAGRLVRLPCLTRSLTLARILARRGVGADVRIGVRTENGKLLAHAWVEWRGRPLNEDPRSLEQFPRVRSHYGGGLND
jgi:hypothetical protein